MLFVVVWYYSIKCTVFTKLGLYKHFLLPYYKEMMLFVISFSVIFVNEGRVGFQRAQKRLLWGEKWKSQGCFGVTYILSAFSTTPGPALSPPVFRCHDDDVKLHHRSCPVNSLRGGASNPEKSTEGAIIFCVSNRQITVLPLSIYPCLAVQNARNCAFTGRSVWKPDRSQGAYSIILFPLAVLFFFLFKSRRRCEEPPKHPRIS